MTRPDKQTWKLPADRYNRATEITCEREGAHDRWIIVIHPLNQRDDGERIQGLSTPQMQAIAQIVAGWKP